MSTKAKSCQPTKPDPALWDTAASGSVSYPQNKEGGLNKFAKSEKDKRFAKAFDNFDITRKQRLKHDYKTTTDVMGLNIETTKLIWILFNEDTELRVAGIILALFKSLQQKENTIRPLCKGALDRRDEIITKNVKQINDVLETLKSNFIDNQGDFAELLVEEDNEGVMADLIEKKMNEKPEAVDDAIFSIIKHMAD